LERVSGIASLDLFPSRLLEFEKRTAPANVRPPSMKTPGLLRLYLTSSAALALLVLALGASAAELTISGTRFQLDGKPFPYTGVSFFNAIYNTNFNASSEARVAWLKKFQNYGINALRVWCQWDSKRGFVDASPVGTMYHADGSLRAEHLATVKDILRDTDTLGMCVELVLFSQESWRENTRIPEPADERAVTTLTRELMSFRNVTFQIWNEHSDARVIPLVKVIKSLDPKRLVTNSPGYAGDLGSDEENRVLDFLTPHTSRQSKDRRHWEVAAQEIESLLQKFNKPVVDDEPARNGTSNFGGPKDRTHPTDHILAIYNVWRVSGHPTYHHDMFQTGYGTPAIPPSGVPDPEFSPYHREVFEFLKLRARYEPTK
jgi:hypothetical protein